MLTSGEYDYAFVLPFDSFKGVPARLEKTSDPAVVRAASGSKYIPASALEVVKALEEEPGASYVVVATPCVIEGIKRFMESKGLADTNVAFFGLFCDRTMSFNFLEHFERKYARPGETLSRLDYRTKDAAGWPGNMRLIFSSGRELRLPRAERTRLKSYFQLERCLYCADKLASQADIAFGDCYVKGMEDGLGLSNVIVRTPRGQEILERYRWLAPARAGSTRGSQGFPGPRIAIAQHSQCLALCRSGERGPRSEPAGAVACRPSPRKLAQKDQSGKSDEARDDRTFAGGFES